MTAQWVSTENATPELRFSARAKEGKSGGVFGIFYISGYILPVGQSIHSFFYPQGDSTPLSPFVTLHVSEVLVRRLWISTDRALRNRANRAW